MKNESLRTKRVDLSNSKIRQQIDSAKREKQFNKVLNDVENDVIFTKYVSPDVEFIKQVPLDPRERFKRNLTAKLKKVTTPLHPRERLKQKVAKLEDELKFMKVVPSHPRDRLKRRIKALEDELVFIKQIPSYPRDTSKRKVKQSEDEMKFIKQVPSHPRERFKRKVAVLNDALKFIKQTPVHPRDRLRRRNKSNGVQFIKQQPFIQERG